MNQSYVPVHQLRLPECAWVLRIVAGACVGQCYCKGRQSESGETSSNPMGGWQYLRVGVGWNRQGCVQVWSNDECCRWMGPVVRQMLCRQQMGDINGATHHKVLTSLHQKDFGNVTVIPGVIKLFHKCDPSACEALRPHHEIFIAVHGYLQEICE